MINFWQLLSSTIVYQTYRCRLYFHSGDGIMVCHLAAVCQWTTAMKTAMSRLRSLRFLWRRRNAVATGCRALTNRPAMRTRCLPTKSARRQVILLNPGSVGHLLPASAQRCHFPYHYVRQGGYVCDFVCLSLSRITLIQNAVDEFWWNFSDGWNVYVTSTGWLDFGVIEITQRIGLTWIFTTAASSQ